MSYWKVRPVELSEKLKALTVQWGSGHGDSHVRKLNCLLPIILHDSTSLDRMRFVVKKSIIVDPFPVNIYIQLPFGFAKLFSGSLCMADFFRSHWKGTIVESKLFYVSSDLEEKFSLNEMCLGVEYSVAHAQALFESAADLSHEQRLLNGIEENKIYSVVKANRDDVDWPFKNSFSFDSEHRIKSMLNPSSTPNHRKVRVFSHVTPKTPSSKERNCGFKDWKSNLSSKSTNEFESPSIFDHLETTEEPTFGEVILSFGSKSDSQNYFVVTHGPFYVVRCVRFGDIVFEIPVMSRSCARRIVKSYEESLDKECFGLYLTHRLDKVRYSSCLFKAPDAVIQVFKESWIDTPMGYVFSNSVCDSDEVYPESCISHFEFLYKTSGRIGGKVTC
ncbi:TPA: hypothetical protein I7730_14690 [Vibrio vulnificus]|uniref:Uncharacterized protein n=1 Tax=Vibrio vulnificus TaxID=672 RepID=A0A8H9N1G3_VIBVL|nr:hypothetical protein [Vibrio vulnificus]HAS8541024.1 hypothetical protein [Vibrio vulnificus]